VHYRTDKSKMKQNLKKILGFNSLIYLPMQQQGRTIKTLHIQAGGDASLILMCILIQTIQ
jgi:hypothetical protein